MSRHIAGDLAATGMNWFSRRQDWFMSSAFRDLLRDMAE